MESHKLFGYGPTPTFCLELYGEKEDQLLVGWYLDNSKLTTHYFFIWITDAVEKICIINGRKTRRLESASDIISYDAIMVKKPIMDAWLLTQGITTQYCWDIVNNRDVLFQNNHKVIFYYGNQSSKEKVSFMRSFKVNERPVLLVLRKEMLEQLAVVSYSVRNGVMVRKMERKINELSDIPSMWQFLESSPIVVPVSDIILPQDIIKDHYAFSSYRTKMA